MRPGLGRAPIWVREGGKPLPRARALPPPRMRQRRGFRGAGEGAAAGRAPRRKTKSSPTELGKSSAHFDIQRTCKYMYVGMQISSIFFASTAWALFLSGGGGGGWRAPVSPGIEDTEAGSGSGSRKGFSAGGEGGAAPSPSAQARQAGAGLGAPPSSRGCV